MIPRTQSFTAIKYSFEWDSHFGIVIRVALASTNMPPAGWYLEDLFPFDGPLSGAMLEGRSLFSNPHPLSNGIGGRG